MCVSKSEVGAVAAAEAVAVTEEQRCVNGIEFVRTCPWGRDAILGNYRRYGRSFGASDVLNRIRRRYRKQHGKRADWKGYVAGLMGVSAYTVGAWRVGTQGPAGDRIKRLRRICSELGQQRRRRGRELQLEQAPAASNFSFEI